MRWPLAVSTHDGGDRARPRGSAGESQLLVGVGEVPLDGPDAQGERLAYLLVRAPVGRKAKNVDLTRREFVEPALRVRGKGKAVRGQGTPSPRA